VIKRAFDLVVSAFGCVVLAPVMAVAALGVWFSDGRPVLYRQVRVGRDGVPFTLLKFRSMRDAAGSDVTVSGDGRVFPVGRVLRASKLDELPQLWNVVRGEMSIVGPRPELPRYVAMWPEELALVVLGVRPGITDPASIAYRDEERILAQSADPAAEYTNVILPDKLRINVEYLNRRTFRSDLGVIMSTVRAVLRGSGGTS
jgi:lipopolysaccharide/colanic/teichoic acid biosynthesis glycosyltransferase